MQLEFMGEIRPKQQRPDSTLPHVTLHQSEIVGVAWRNRTLEDWGPSLSQVRWGRKEDDEPLSLQYIG